MPKKQWFYYRSQKVKAIQFQITKNMVIVQKVIQNRNINN